MLMLMPLYLLLLVPCFSSKAKPGAKSIARFNVFTCALVAAVFFASAALSFFSSPSQNEEYEDETAAWSLLVLGLAHLVSVVATVVIVWGEDLAT